MNAWAIKNNKGWTIAYGVSEAQAWSVLLYARAWTKADLEKAGYTCVEVSVTEKPTQPESAEPVEVQWDTTTGVVAFHADRSTLNRLVQIGKGTLYAHPPASADEGVVSDPWNSMLAKAIDGERFRMALRDPGLLALFIAEATNPDTYGNQENPVHPKTAEVYIRRRIDDLMNKEK